MAGRARIGVIAAVLAASNLLSAVLGYARESLIAGLFGNGLVTDAYFSAFRLPDFLNHLLAGGVVSVAFLPRYTELYLDDPERADGFLGVLLGSLGLLAIAATGVAWLFADPLTAALFAFDPEAHALTVRLTRIVLPAQVFFILGGIMKVPLFARDRFAAVALAPLLYNVSIIAGGWLGRSHGIDGFAWGVLVGAFLGSFAVPLWTLLRARVRLRPRVAFADADLRAALWIAVPLMVGVSLLTVDEWYLNILASHLPAGTVSHLMRARTLMRLPVVVVGQALGVAALPTLARLWAQRSVGELDALVESALRAAIGIGALGAAAMVTLGTPLTVLLFERGTFTAGDSAAVAGLLSVLALAVPGFLAQQLAVRAFYARADTWRPMLLATGVALAALPVYVVLADRAGAPGLAWATCLSLTASALATSGLARLAHGAPKLGGLAVSMLRSALGSALAGGAAWGALVGLRAAGPGWSRQVEALVQLLAGGAAFTAAGVCATLLVGDPPARAALLRLLRRLVRR